MQVIKELFYILCFLLCTVFVVFILNKITTPIESPAQKIEREFRTACTQAGGTTAWNRQNWVCIK